MSQLVDLSLASAKLRFFDVRLLNRIGSDLSKQINQLDNWNHATSLVDSFCRYVSTLQYIRIVVLYRLKLGRSAAWTNLTTWINSNASSAKVSQLSRVVSGMAIMGIEVFLWLLQYLLFRTENQQLLS